MDPMHDQTAASLEALGAPQGASSDAVEGRSSLDRFLARAAERRAEQAAHPERVTGPWVEPDPRAITALPERRRPIAVFMRELAQTPTGISKRKTTLRHILAELTDQPRKEVTWEQVQEYPWHHVSADMAEDFYFSIHQQYSNGHTRNKYIAYLRSVIRRCQRAKLMSLESTAEILEQLPMSAVKARAMHARRLWEQEIAALIQACDEGSEFMRARDAGMLAVFATTGPRVSELVKLDLCDWDQTEQCLTLRHTKNGRDRLIPVDERVAKYLDAWLVVRGGEPGPLFTRAEGRKGGSPHLSTHAVRERIKILAARAGLGTVHTHDFRRTVASSLLRTHDASLTARLLGHASLAATMTYDLSNIDEQRAAIRSLPLPDVDADDDLEENAS